MCIRDRAQRARGRVRASVRGRHLLPAAGALPRRPCALACIWRSRQGAFATYGTPTGVCGRSAVSDA
eukprot:10776888-Alexandrium_andersonii.AAC.1